MRKIALKQTKCYEEDTYEVVNFDIEADGVKAGQITCMIDENSCYIDGIFVEESKRNQGIGTAALHEISSMYNDCFLAPDNEDAARLYARIGYERHGGEADYVDQGFGVYTI